MVKKLLLATMLFGATEAVHAQTTIGQNTDQHDFTFAQKLLDRGDYVAARLSYEKYLKNTDQPFAEEAAYGQAYTAMRCNDADALKLYEDFIANYPAHPKHNLALNDVGDYYFRKRKYAKSLEYYQKVDSYQLSEEQAVAYNFHLAYANFSEEKFELAYPIFSNLKRKAGEYQYRSAYYAGVIAYQEEDYDQAVMDLKLAANDPQFKAQVPYMVANIYYKQMRYEELVAYVAEHKNVRSLSNRRELILLTGAAYFQLGNYQDAGVNFDEYLKGNRSTPSADVLYRVAFTYYKLGETEKAINTFKKVAATDDDSAVLASYYLGQLYLTQGNEAYALTAFDQVRQAEVEPAVKEESDFQYAYLNYKLGRLNVAVEALQEFVATYPRSRYVHQATDLIGDAYLNTRNYEQALTYFDQIPNKSVKVRQAYQELAYKRGVELFNNNEPDQAVEFFNRSLRYPLDPEFENQAIYWIGEAKSLEKNWGDAINAYARVFVLAAPNSQLYTKANYGIGYAYFNSKQYKKAIPHFKDYTNSLKRSADKMFYNDALLRLGDCYYVTKSYQEATRTYQLAIDQGLENQDHAWFQKGVVAQISGQVKTAAADYDHLINMVPRSTYYAKACLQKGQLYMEASQYQKAISAFDVLVANMPQSPYVPLAILKKAGAEYNLQKYDHAAKSYITILNNYPQDPVAHEALMALQESLASAGKPEQFNKYLAEYKERNPDGNLTNVELEAAKSLYYAQKYEAAMADLQKFVNSYPKHPSVAEARYLIGEINYRTNKVSEAMTAYKQVVREGKNNFINKSLLRLASLTQELGDYDQSIAYGRLLAERSTKKKERYNAWSGLMKAYYDKQSYDSAIYFAHAIKEKAAVNVNAGNTANLFIGKSLLAKGDNDAAMDQFVALMNSAKDENGAEAQYILADLFYQKKEYKQSVETLYDLSQQFGIYPKWVGKSYLLMVDNYVAMDELFQAKATLNSIIKNASDKTLIHQAEDRLTQVEEALSKQVAAKDTTAVKIDQPDSLNVSDANDQPADSTIH
ncbi:tetratricopeptide repeat protein [Persicobacter psychrovividus]|uniref:Tetratricopeptide repeat protein n=1 Tax=Persicobacter psychrovividus TaxID=387638 RepID=A0ABN6LC50_9BACT|nr:hypothetical protein PEPS_12440 [Persicobacter psychrovividus]